MTASSPLSFRARSRGILTLLLASLMAGGLRAETGPVGFARAEIAAAAVQARGAEPVVAFAVDPGLGPQGYRIERLPDGVIRVTAGDPAGEMYGGLDVAEAVRLGAAVVREVTAGGRLHRPYVAQRGIKFNLPLDLRTPSYSDGGDSAQANIPEIWTREFWDALLDEMARHRYNVLSLWNLHPFPSMVRVPEFPDVALDDVWRTRVRLGPDPLDETGRNYVTPAFLADHEVVKKITIAQKIAFWRGVMQRAADRGIAVYVFTWNVFTYGAEGKYGITADLSNRTTIAYFRASVRELVKTYPLLAGIGITAGEQMPPNPEFTKEQWLWATYGEGVRDALKDDPTRTVRLIHRFHQTTPEDIARNWREYPGYPATFAFSYKYSVAHMYSSTRPPFIAEVRPFLRDGMKTWLTLRNDDIYSFRWGDPDYAREYLLNLPPASELAGFYLGPDGFTWGRDFLDRSLAGKQLGPDRPLVLQKQWYAFLLWGRLAFDPTLPDSRFEEILGGHFPEVDAATLFAASRAASQIIPQITRFFWGDLDFRWFPEACVHKVGRTRFYTVRDFINGTTMPGTGIVDIRTWRQRQLEGKPLDGISPLDVADALAGAADETLRRVSQLRKEVSSAAESATARGTSERRRRELRLTLGDYEAMAELGRYYAAKIRGACALALFDVGGDPADQAAAVTHLEHALDAWKHYAAVRDAQYLPAFYNRIGWIDITALTAGAAEDIGIAKTWERQNSEDPRRSAK